MVRVVLLIPAALLLSGCAHKTSLLGTWTHGPARAAAIDEAGEHAPQVFTTFLPDGTFHSETYGNSPQPLIRSNGVYKLFNKKLSKSYDQVSWTDGKHWHLETSASIEVSGDTLTEVALIDKAAAVPVIWTRVTYAYHIPAPLDRSAEVVGKWRDNHGQVLELMSDKTFRQEATLNGAHFGGPVKGVLDGTYTFSGEFVKLVGQATPSEGNFNGRKQPALVTFSMQYEPAGASTGEVLHFQGNKEIAPGRFVRSK